jgi:hypothetical protein
MSSAIAEPEPRAFERTRQEAGTFDYKPMSMVAVVSFVLAILSAAICTIWFALILPAFNVVLAAIALLRIRGSRGELGGKKLAVWALALSVLALAGGIGFQVYLFQSEIPKDYQRLSFTRDISEKGKIVMNGRNMLHPDLAALDGKRIFLKGFMYPEKQTTGITNFLLVRDSGVCCFGGKPPLSDMIGVSLLGSKTANFYSGRVSVAGTFRLNREYRGASELEPIFLLDGISVARSQCDFDPIEPTSMPKANAGVTAPAVQAPAETPPAA